MFSNNNFYVGLTCNPKTRKKDHLISDIDSKVLLHIEKTGLQPSYEKLTDFLPELIASKQEVYYKRYYEELGFVSLSPVNAGGLGHTLLTTKEECIEVVNKCKNKKELRENYPTIYNSMNNNGWYCELTKHMKNLKKPSMVLNFNICKENADKCKTMCEYRNRFKTSYYYALEYNFLDQITKHFKIIIRKDKIIFNKNPEIYTEEYFRTEIKKYKSRKNLHDTNRKLHKKIKNYGFDYLLDELLPKQNKWIV